MQELRKGIDWKSPSHSASQDAVRTRQALSSSTQARFEELNMDYFRNSMGLMEKCLHDSGFDERDVHDCSCCCTCRWF